MRLWGGETVEWVGGQITVLALPTIAIILLKAGPFEMGVLNSLGFVAYPSLSLFAGVMVDRWRRRPVLVWTNVVQVVVLASIPVAFMWHALSLVQLYLVSLLMGVTAMFFVVAYQAYLPRLVEKENLVEANSKLEASSSVAQVAGPAVAGFLTQLVGATTAVAVDAFSTLVAAIAIQSIKKPEKPVAWLAERDFLAEMKEGINVVIGHPFLRRLAAATATYNFGISMFMAVFFLFMYKQLGLSPLDVGAIFAVGSVGSLLGAIAVPQIRRRLGLGTTLCLSLLAAGGGILAAPAATHESAVLFLAAVWAISGFGIAVYNINQISFRQAVVPNRLQGRMNSTMRTIISGTAAAGALAGGIVGTQTNIVITLSAGAVVALLAVPIIPLSLNPHRNSLVGRRQGRDSGLEFQPQRHRGFSAIG
jgi:MFS family permease